MEGEIDDLLEGAHGPSTIPGPIAGINCDKIAAVRISARKKELVEKAIERLSPLESSCTLCPRDCRVDRTEAADGVCRTGHFASVSHALLHFGEEPVISGQAGSGTIFFAGCNLKCLFCQNYQLSWLLEGEPASDEELAEMMLRLQAEGAHNINLVSPSHVVLPVLRALRVALAAGLDIPLVWNSNGYEKVDVIRALEGVVDVYLPDLKYHSPSISKRYSAAADYFARASEAVREMALQQPALELGPDGTARRGLIVRHLALPGAVDDTLVILRWVREKLSPFIGLSLMSQYHPCYRAPEEIRRGLSPEEYRRAADAAVALGFDQLFLQPEPFGPDDHLVPDFRKSKPFRWK
jgi:putative pyruvate formate lyase activating enzyme